MANISEENRLIAKTASSIFGGKPKVTCYWDEYDKNSVDILNCEGRPQKGVSSYSTLGLSDTPLKINVDDTSVRLEVVGACATSCKEFANILSTAAFCVINSGWSCFPGKIFPDIVSMYRCSSTMRHLLFVPPFLWGGKLKTLRLESKTVAWLLAVPISDAECRYAEIEGADKLEDVFERLQIDIFDIDRPSAM